MQAYANANDASRGMSPANAGREWVVLLTHDTRRMMSTLEVHAELQAGTLSRETLVWRAGMNEWAPIAHVAELDVPVAYQRAMPAGWDAPHAAVPARHAPVHAQRRAPAPNPALAMELVTTGAVALIVIALTSYLLSLGGAFAAGGGAVPHSAASAAKH